MCVQSSCAGSLLFLLYSHFQHPLPIAGLRRCQCASQRQSGIGRIVSRGGERATGRAVVATIGGRSSTPEETHFTLPHIGRLRSRRSCNEFGAAYISDTAEYRRQATGCQRWQQLQQSLIPRTRKSIDERLQSATAGRGEASSADEPAVAEGPNGLLAACHHWTSRRNWPHKRSRSKDPSLRSWPLDGSPRNSLGTRRAAASTTYQRLKLLLNLLLISPDVKMGESESTAGFSSKLARDAMSADDEADRRAEEATSATSKRPSGRPQVTDLPNSGEAAISHAQQAP